MRTVWGHVGPGQAELTVEEAGLGSGVAFGVAIPSPAQLLAVEEIPEPGAGVQAVPAGGTSALSPAPRARSAPPPARGTLRDACADLHCPGRTQVRASLPSLIVSLLFARLSPPAKMLNGTDTP